jgi:hypothetical protein
MKIQFLPEYYGKKLSVKYGYKGNSVFLPDYRPWALIFDLPKKNSKT